MGICTAASRVSDVAKSSADKLQQEDCTVRVKEPLPVLMSISCVYPAPTIGGVCQDFAIAGSRHSHLGEYGKSFRQVMEMILSFP